MELITKYTIDDVLLLETIKFSKKAVGIVEKITIDRENMYYSIKVGDNIVEIDGETCENAFYRIISKVGNISDVKK